MELRLGEGGSMPSSLRPLSRSRDGLREEFSILFGCEPSRRDNPVDRGEACRRKAYHMHRTHHGGAGEEARLDRDRVLPLHMGRYALCGCRCLPLLCLCRLDPLPCSVDVVGQTRQLQNVHLQLRFEL